jgi:hypothetical protein
MLTFLPITVCGGGEKRERERKKKKLGDDVSDQR